eukprot:3174273-Prymnesium_polylepis.3
MSDSIPSADVLRKSLAALGLSVYGTREKMYERLQSKGEKQKPGPKPCIKHKKEPTPPLAPKTCKTKAAKVSRARRAPAALLIMQWTVA